MPYKSKLSRKAKFRRFGYVFFFGLIAVVIGAIIYMIFEPGGGPRSVTRGDRAELSPEQRTALMGESRELERRFNESVAGEEKPGGEEIAILREAYDKLRRAVTNNPYASMSDRQRLDRLREYLVEYEGDYLGGRVAALRAQAAEERAAGAYLNAESLIEEALEIQVTINRELRQSPHSSNALVSALNRELVNLRAEPIIARSRDAEDEALQAVREERWADALDLYSEALEGQVRINQDFQRTPYTDRTRVNRLEEEIASLETLGVRSEIASLEEEGRVLLEEGSFEEAAERFALAARRQTELNRRFPGSRYASTAAVRELESVRQTALSGELAQELEDAVETMNMHLRERQPAEARSAMSEADRLIRTLEGEFPLSEFGDDELSLRISYLNSIQGRIGSILEEVYENLEAVPGGNGVMLYRYETPQRLYSGIMNRNPSRNVGPDLPVDSVNLGEAEEFCRRLSWVLGKTVRLPTREEFLLAAGDLPAVDEVSRFAWHLRNSGGESRQVGTRDRNAHGFHDLLGNVAEWTSTNEGDRRAWVAGGSYDDELDEGGELPFRAIEVNDRSRAIGFRFVVEEQFT